MVVSLLEDSQSNRECREKSRISASHAARSGFPWRHDPFTCGQNGKQSTMAKKGLARMSALDPGFGTRCSRVQATSQNGSHIPEPFETACPSALSQKAG